MRMNERECWSCAARPEEAAFPPMTPAGQHRRCLDCLSLESRQPENRGVKVVTRASYRAARRWRGKSNQMDLIDLIVAGP